MPEEGSLLEQLKEQYPWIVEAKENSKTFFFYITLADQGLRESEIHQKAVRELNGFFSVVTQPVPGMYLKNFNSNLKNGFNFLLAIVSHEKTVLTVLGPKKEVLI